MRKVIVLFLGIALSLVVIQSVMAEVAKGRFELSAGAAFMGIQESGGETQTAFNLSSRVGYFVTKQFEIEPEMIFSKFEGGDPGIIVNANLLYNLSLSENSVAVPFFLAGVGFSNSIHYFNQMNLGDVTTNYTVLNLGLGSKLFLTNSIALRLEYRFQRFFAKKEEFWWGYTHDPSLNYHNILFGFSVFLK